MGDFDLYILILFHNQQISLVHFFLYLPFSFYKDYKYPINLIFLLILFSLYVFLINISVMSDKDKHVFISSKNNQSSSSGYFFALIFSFFIILHRSSSVIPGCILIISTDSFP